MACSRLRPPCHHVAVTVPADPPSGPPSGHPGAPAPAARSGRRRWWLIGGSILWAVLITALGVLSARRDPPSIPDQVELAAAVPALDRATGVVLAAVGADAVVAIGPLIVDRGCRITSVRPGAEATRDVTVYVRPGDGPAALEAMASGLPPEYGAELSRSRSGTRQLLFADAGDYIAVRGSVDDDGKVLTVRSSTGCRPNPDAVTPAEQPAGQVPAPLTAASNALQLSGTGAATAREIGCPGGGVARTVAVEGTPAAGGLTALRPVTAGATVVEADPGRYAYRSGDASVVAAESGGRVRITTTVAC